MADVLQATHDCCKHFTTLCFCMQGNGFITDYNIIAKYGLSDANRFFNSLLDKPYADKVGVPKVVCIHADSPLQPMLC